MHPLDALVVGLPIMAFITLNEHCVPGHLHLVLTHPHASARKAELALFRDPPWRLFRLNFKLWTSDSEESSGVLWAKSAFSLKDTLHLPVSSGDRPFFISPLHLLSSHSNFFEIDVMAITVGSQRHSPRISMNSLH